MSQFTTLVAFPNRAGPGSRASILSDAGGMHMIDPHAATCLPPEGCTQRSCRQQYEQPLLMLHTTCDQNNHAQRQGLLSFVMQGPLSGTHYRVHALPPQHNLGAATAWQACSLDFGGPVGAVQCVCSAERAPACSRGTPPAPPVPQCCWRCGMLHCVESPCTCMGMGQWVQCQCRAFARCAC